MILNRYYTYPTNERTTAHGSGSFWYYMGYMKILCMILFFFSCVPVTQAAFLYEPGNAKEVLALEDISQQTIYGKLSGFPHTFTFVVAEDTPFRAQVSIGNGELLQEVSFILIKQEKRGVSEIGRLSGIRATSPKDYDLWRAVTFVQSEEFVRTLEAGVYTLELSSPENNRGYRLILGEGDQSPVKELSYARSVFDINRFSILLVPYVLVSLGVGLFFMVRWYRRSRKNEYA
jgi:hypothetical protein